MRSNINVKWSSTTTEEPIEASSFTFLQAKCIIKNVAVDTFTNLNFSEFIAETYDNLIFGDTMTRYSYVGFEREFEYMVVNKTEVATKLKLIQKIMRVMNI